MHLTVTALSALTALALGFVTGRAWQRGSRAWTDLKTAKTQVSTFRTAVRVLSSKAAGWALITATVAAVWLYAVAAGQR